MNSDPAAPPLQEILPVSHMEISAETGRERPCESPGDVAAKGKHDTGSLAVRAGLYSKSVITSEVAETSDCSAEPVEWHNTSTGSELDTEAGQQNHNQRHVIDVRVTNDRTPERWSSRKRQQMTRRLTQAQISFRARNRWRKALNYALMKVRDPPMRPIVITMAKAYTGSVAMCFFSAYLLFLLEGESLVQQEKAKFPYMDASFGEQVCGYFAGLYVFALITHRVGYGDILIYTNGGRAVCAICGLFLCMTFTTVFQAKAGTLLDMVLSYPATYIIRPLDASWEPYFYIIMYGVMLLLVMTTGAMILTFSPSETDTRLSHTDAFWYMWSTYTSVGYGDIAITDLADHGVKLSHWMIATQYGMFVIGMTLFDTLILRGFLLFSTWVSARRKQAIEDTQMRS